jgi:hypothetical protein
MNWVRRYLLILLIIFLTGCATSIDLLKTKTVPQNENIVFGRIKVIWKGEEVNWPTFPINRFNVPPKGLSIRWRGVMVLSTGIFGQGTTPLQNLIGREGQLIFLGFHPPSR